MLNGTLKKMKNKRNYAIILASGKGTRLNSDLPKQFINIGGKTVIEHTLDRFQMHSEIDEIIIVIEPSNKNRLQKILDDTNYTKISKILNGGKTRQDSSAIGVNSITETTANVLIHDAARPFVSQNIITNCLKALKTSGAVAVAIPAVDTIIEIDSKNHISNIPERKYMMQVQTPQAFNLEIIKKAHALAAKESYATDDCSLVLKHNIADIFIVSGEKTNIKITYPEDIEFAEIIIKNLI